MKRTVCIDFDGVIYHNLKYHGPSTVVGPAVEGALSGIMELSNSYIVVVHSARCGLVEGFDAVNKWLLENGFLDYCELVRDKPRAMVYLDDRGICFTGDWERSIADIGSFKQWQTDQKVRNRINRRRLKRR